MQGTLVGKERAAAAIQNLAASVDSRAALMQLGAREKLLKLLDEGTPAAKERAARAIWNLGCSWRHNVMVIVYSCFCCGSIWLYMASYRHL